MGYPLRFIGTGETIEIEGVTIPARSIVEVTFNCYQDRFLMRPDAEANEIILGCLGRALHRYPELNLHVVSVLSNHGCLLASPSTAAVLSSFMRDFESTLARRLNRHRGRKGGMFQRRFRSIPAIDEAAVDERFAYVLLQGSKEGLVYSGRDWPGVNSIDALTGAAPMVGRWLDVEALAERKRQRRRRLARARARGRALSLPTIQRVYREYPIELVPLAHWFGDEGDDEARRAAICARVRALVDADERETRARHAANGTAPLGTKAVRQTNPFACPRDPKRSPAPLCHVSEAGGRRARKAYRKAYGLYVLAFHESAAKLAAARREVGFLPGATSPPLPDVGERREPRPDPELCVVYGDADAGDPEA